MPKKTIKKYMPNPEKLKEHKHLQFLGERLHEPNLWHLNRRSISLAFAIGLFVAWVPTPGQMAIAAVGAFYFRANLPVSVALVWVTNPLTMPPMFYFAYMSGLFLLGRELPNNNNFEFSIDSVMTSIGDIGGPFLFGCLILGIVSSTIGYFGMSLLWRYAVTKRWNKRKDR
ncbi:DUF2062 domain-containing protein [Methylomarinum sp. Ch1-1]|uniref:DUF2062 domain-containing protein n=1 Tax=Methylomarinum roseum TaxID=3067653 RepID=A0AAU7NZS0_9GAMM|nr:DUF2062 domain-containing protein [Methylomarinum sp. Ch1-1]MDP4521349.1 DUF2062 domain-containing protein [Methylomarinum sp. Ch1-1]